MQVTGDFGRAVGSSVEMGVRLERSSINMDAEMFIGKQEDKDEWWRCLNLNLYVGIILERK